MVATIGDPPHTTRGKKQRISVFGRVRPLLEHLGEGKILDSTEHTNNDYSHFGSSSSSSSAMYGGGGGGVSSSNSNASSSYGSSAGSSHHLPQRRVFGKSCVRCVSDTEVVVRGAHQQQLHHSSSAAPPDSHIEHHGHAAVRPRLSTGTASKSPLLTRGTPATLVTPRSTAARHASPPGRAQLPQPTTTSNSSSNIGEMSFQFNGVFDPHCTQQDIYEETMLELLDRALRPSTSSSSLSPASSGDAMSSSSVHVSLLCYGPTGSGKTYSMVGAWDPARDPTMTMGILPRTALQILSQIDAHRIKVEKCRLHQQPLLSSDSTAVRRTTPAASNQGPAVPVGLTLFAVELYLDELRDLLLLAHQGTNSATAARRASSPSLGRSNTPPRMGTSSSSLAAGGVVGRQQSCRASSSPLVLRHGVSFPNGRLFKEGAQSIPASSTPASFFHSTSAASAPIMTAPSSSTTAQAYYGASTIPVKDYTSFEELCDTLCGAEITSLSSLQDIYHSISNTRMTSSTASNDKSSRSHAFFILRISFDSSSPRGGGSTPVSPSFVVLADLAGSERLKQSQAEGVGVLEAQSINKSLSALCTVVTSLHQNSKHVPFRDSRLTRLLRPCLENGWVTALVHVPPADGQRDEAIQTLKFAERMSQTVLPSVSTAVTATQQHRSAAGGDLQLRDASSYFDDPRKQEALEFQNERAQLQMDVLSAELRIANAAYGHLPRRLATLPLAYMATLYPEWHTAWQRVRHALETDTAEGTSVARSVVDRTKREIMLKVNALKSALEKESQEVENLRESLAQLENNDDGGDEALSSQSIYKKLQREHSAAIKIKLLVQHRLLVLSENEAHLKRQAHHIKTDLLDEAGSWHSLHRNVDDASESLQCETRNGLVMQGLFADQCDVLRDILAYLEEKRHRRRIERLCVEAEALGYGQLVLSNQASQQEGRHLTRNNGKSSLSSSYRKQQPLADDALFLDDEDDDVCSIDWEEYHDEVGGTSDGKRNDNKNTATNNNTQQHQKKQQDVNSIFQCPLAPVEISGGVVVKRSIFVERSLFSSPTQSSSSKRDNNNGGASQSIFKSSSSQTNNKTASSSRSSANEPTREDLPTAQQRHHHPHAVSSISGDGSGSAASIFVTLRQRHLVPWYAATRVVPAPKHWAPRPLLLHGWYDAPHSTRTAHDNDDEGERVAAAVHPAPPNASHKEGGVSSSSGGRRGTNDRQLCSLPSLTGHYHNPEARRYVALRALSSRSSHIAHLVVSSTQRYDPKSINSSSSALVALSIIKHEGNTRRLQLMSVNATPQQESFPFTTTNNEGVTSGADTLLNGWVTIPPRRLSGSAEKFNTTTSSMCIVVVDEMVPSRHLLALHVVVARAHRGGGFNEATGVASQACWVLLEFSNATLLELVYFAVTPFRVSVDESQTSSSGLLLHRLSAVVTEVSTMLPGGVPVVTLADYYRRLDSTGGKLTTEVLSSSSCTTTIIPQLSSTSSLAIVIEDVSACIRDTLTLVYTFTPTTHTAEYVLLSRILSSVVKRPEEASKSISLGDVRTLCNPHGFNIFALALLLRHMASQHHGAHLSGQ